MERDKDISGQLAETVREAAAHNTALAIVGGGTKTFYGLPCAGQQLDVGGHRGIVSYEPTELVITARAGTPLADIETALAEKNQMLGFEPPHFGIKPPASQNGSPSRYSTKTPISHGSMPAALRPPEWPPSPEAIALSAVAARRLKEMVRREAAWRLPSKELASEGSRPSPRESGATSNT